MQDADPDLIASWLRGRSIARHLPAPVDDLGGWRVDTRSDAEWARHVFATALPGITELGERIVRPRLFLKLCDTNAALRLLLPAKWQILNPSWVMTGPDVARDVPLPGGYHSTIEMADGVAHVEIKTPDGAFAACGFAAETTGAFVYDRIVTTPDHQRKGLGVAVMALLATLRQSASSRPVLVATEQGRALYQSLGWQVHAPYATAVIPDSLP